MHLFYNVSYEWDYKASPRDKQFGDKKAIYIFFVFNPAT
jgi:hypothetical protein